MVSESLTPDNEIETEINRLITLTQGFGIFVERELTTRRIKDKMLREMIVKTHADRMEQVKAQREKVLALLARDAARIARLEKVCEAARYMLAVGPYAKARDQLTVALSALDADAPGGG